MRSKADISQLNQPHGTKTKNRKKEEKNKNENIYAEKKRSAWSQFLKEEKSLWWEGCVKQASFKPRVKE